MPVSVSEGARQKLLNSLYPDLAQQTAQLAAVAAIAGCDKPDRPCRLINVPKTGVACAYCNKQIQATWDGQAVTLSVKR